MNRLELITDQYSPLLTESKLKSVQVDGNVIVDLSFSEIEKKIALAAECQQNNIQLILDITSYPAHLFEKYDCIMAFVATQLAPTNKIEFMSLNNKDKAFKVLNQLGFSPIHYPFASVGMVFSRTLAMLAQEAYLALEDNIASSEDIDKAMRYGVNYPRGPIEWIKGKESIIVCLLKYLHEIYQDSRYQLPSLLLKVSQANQPSQLEKRVYT
jgi:hypothetical protein